MHWNPANRKVADVRIRFTEQRAHELRQEAAANKLQNATLCRYLIEYAMENGGLEALRKETHKDISAA